MVWKDIINYPQVPCHLSEKRIKWSFIIEFFSWICGFYERLIGTTKKILNKSTERLHLTKTQLRTIITTVEKVVNSGPLVYLDNDLENQIITPMHFLSLNTKNGTPALISEYEKNDPNDQDYQNEEMTMTQKVLKHGKKLTSTSNSSGNQGERIIY